MLTQRLVEAVASGGEGTSGAAEAEDSLSAGIYCSMAACFQSSVIRQARQAEAMGQMREGDEEPLYAVTGPRINPITTYVRYAGLCRTGLNLPPGHERRES